MRTYLDESTEPKITKVAEQELIAEQVRRRVHILVRDRFQHVCHPQVGSPGRSPWQPHHLDCWASR